MSKPDVTIGTATKRGDFLDLVEYVSRGDYLDGSSGTTTLTTDDFGRTVIINSGSNRTVNLPSVDTTEIGGWFIVVKLGAGNVTIQAADSDTINGGAAGGTLVNSVAGETDAYVRVRLVSATGWVIEGGVGTWATSAATFYLGPRSTQTNLTLAALTMTGAIALPEISTPSTPASGHKIYTKSDGYLYSLNAAGEESRLVRSSEVLPILGNRRWAAARASGSTVLQSLIDLTSTGTGTDTHGTSTPTYLKLVTGATSGDYKQWYTQNYSLIASPAGLFDATWRIYFETLTNCRAWIGFTGDYAAFQADTDDPSSAVLAAFRFAPAVSANIYACTKNVTTLTAEDTGVAAAASWFTLRIVAASASQIDFYINGVKTNSLTTNIPASAMQYMLFMIMTKTSGAANLRFGSFCATFAG